ncbi:hypothetical protein AA13595_1322 [Gluconacetobacter johannae DSM 13595]|uniref:DUF2635 domain-containing protein n=1 Tax=Gluconacetobacter johannae TaxID=112140 RepID=A0A7W4P461_9PROT|nr:DUF2635 domain-containing protein [Gluconacetobacter johannae]MBB2176772.1 DUF2635 domain-containing protein [Gluconacetobacter johannae]GBQ84097.1 hypothetical protein AA13595_1322 [Gluconacetobacter johannae DSM 13595]
MFVKPGPGRAVRWPGTLRLLAPEGAEVPETTFWLLCLKHGDVVKAVAPGAAAIAAPAPAPPDKTEVPA